MPYPPHARLLAVIFSSWLLSWAPLRSQEVMDVMRGRFSYETFGMSACNLGDVDSDGIGDFGVARQATSAGLPVLTVYSGVDRSVIREYLNVAGQQDIIALSRAGDVDRDGVIDLIVGLFEFVGHGHVVVLSGASGAVLYHIIDPVGSHFPAAVADAGDVNADGYADLLVGTPDYYNGSATIYSGADGAILHHFSGATGQYDLFGSSIAGLGDVDLDGYDDVLVAAPSYKHLGLRDCGSVSVFSGRDGTRIHFLVGESRSHLGIPSCAMSDANGDGVPEFAVGDQPSSAGYEGRVQVFSGADAAVLGAVDVPAYARGINADGDYDGDGRLDLAIGYEQGLSNGWSSGGLTVFSGRDRSVLLLTDGVAPYARFGQTVAFVGDLNGDRRDELLVTAPWEVSHAQPGSIKAGAVYLLSGAPGHDLLLRVPPIGMEASVMESLQVEQATPFRRVHLAASDWGLGTTSIPQLQIHLALQRARLLATTTADAQGIANFSLTIPNLLRGRTIWFQACERGKVSNWSRRILYWPWYWG